MGSNVVFVLSTWFDIGEETTLEDISKKSKQVQSDTNRTYIHVQSIYI